MLLNPNKKAAGLIISMGICVLLFVAGSFSAWEQSADLERSIKCSGNYYWGEAVGDSLEQTRIIAKKDAVQSISQTISVSENLRITDRKGLYQDEYVTTTKSFSRLHIQGINYLESRRNGKYRIVAYLSKNDFNHTVETVAVEVKERIAIAERHERERGMADAVCGYYCAYLAALSSPRPIRYESQVRKATYEDVKPVLFEKVCAFLSNIKINAESPHIDRTFDLIAIPVRAVFNDKPLSGIAVCFDIPDGSERIIEKGAADLFLYSDPSVRRRKYTIICSIALDKKSGYSELADIHREAGIFIKRQVEVDFSSIIGIDFTIEKGKDSRCTFIPRLSNISVSAMRWDFGDGKTSTDYSPGHSYDVKNECLASLTVNNSSDLTASRFLRANDCGPDLKPVVNRRAESDGGSFNENPVSKNIPPEIHNLAVSRDYQTFAGLLEDYKSKNALIYGAKAAFFDPTECYVFIIDRDAHTLVAALDKGGARRCDILTGTIIDNFESKYKQKLSLWVEVYK